MDNLPDGVQSRDSNRLSFPSPGTDSGTAVSVEVKLKGKLLSYEVRRYWNPSRVRVSGPASHVKGLRKRQQTNRFAYRKMASFDLGQVANQISRPKS